MMRPYFRSIIFCPKTWQARRVPVRLVSKMPFHSSSLTSIVGVRFVIPAELTRISTVPNSLSTVDNKVWRLARSVTFEAIASDLRPSARISSAADRTKSCRRPVGTTLAPASAKPFAEVSPIPDVPPITTAVFEVSSSEGCPIQKDSDCYWGSGNRPALILTHAQERDRVLAGRIPQNENPTPNLRCVRTFLL